MAVAVLLSGLVWPSAAQAHGIAGGTTLPIPGWLFAWAATLVLVISFVALAVLWPTPRLGSARPHRLLLLPRWLDVLAGATGIALFVVVVYSGLAGEQSATSNIVPTWVFVAFWVGVPLLSVVFGDVFRALNPWRAAARAAAELTRRLAPRAGRAEALPYPSRLGCWPAAVGLLAFAWLELVYVNRDQPRTLAVLAVAYAGVQLIGMALYGIETWTRRADLQRLLLAHRAPCAADRARPRALRADTAVRAAVARSGAGDGRGAVRAAGHHDLRRAVRRRPVDRRRHQASRAPARRCGRSTGRCA